MSEQLAEQFVETYYLTMQKNKDDMIAFYTDDSILTYEGNHNKGLKEIQERLEQMTYQTVQYS
jgi:Nuclear transport factor 2 (NTF2) domain.